MILPTILPILPGIKGSKWRENKRVPFPCLQHSKPKDLFLKLMGELAIEGLCLDSRTFGTASVYKHCVSTLPNSTQTIAGEGTESCN
jgi:hypothetical protein